METCLSTFILIHNTFLGVCGAREDKSAHGMQLGHRVALSSPKVLSEHFSAMKLLYLPAVGLLLCLGLLLTISYAGSKSWKEKKPSFFLPRVLKICSRLSVILKAYLLTYRQRY